ncbi:MAG TPA: glycoside hydrolase family 18 protein [Chitinophagaceae bacterium]|nr:glycoside hydrolase family 18 protein [Chitinophagaceae bacterium]
MKKALLFLLGALLCFTTVTFAQSKKSPISIIAYYAGDSAHIDAYPVEELTHIIYSFTHLKGNEIYIHNKRDSATIKHLVALKKRNPKLKIILSMGGWGGCGPCSEVFSTDAGRKEFAASVLHTLQYFSADGIDLDWEYPAIPGYPGHRFVPEDKPNFTALCQALRDALGNKYEVSFAAGGFTTYLQQSIEWDKIAPLVDKVNLMTYDLVHGFSKVTGHHTPLYSTPEQKESVDNAVRYLDSIHFPVNKLVVGAAFYARIFDVDVDANKGLYQPGKFDHGVDYNHFNKDSLENLGFVFYWDDVAKAPYGYNQKLKQVITFDDKRSLALKTKYAIYHHLNGIMFWELGNDVTKDGLLQAIYDAATH